MITRLAKILPRVLFVLSILVAALWLSSIYVAESLEIRYAPASFIALQSVQGSARLELGTVHDRTRIKPATPRLVLRSVSTNSYNSGYFGHFAFDSFVQPGFAITVVELPLWFLIAGLLALPGWRFLGRPQPAPPLRALPTTMLENGAPDWPAIEDQIECPLCQYNLRGLSDPRCPECGYRFNWPDLLDPSRKTHPYLFEQATGRQLRSLLKTLTRNFKPGQFWKTLHPSHHLNPRRLALYAIIVFLIAISPAVVCRSIDSDYTITGLSVWAGRTSVFDRYSGAITLTCILAVVYPVASFMALMIFQQTMRRAKVLSRHVVRCVIYSADIIVWFTLCQYAAIIASRIREQFADEIMFTVYLFGSLVTIIVVTSRLCSAYRHYMKFPQPWATVILSQLVVIIAMAVGIVLSDLHNFLN